MGQSTTQRIDTITRHAWEWARSEAGKNAAWAFVFVNGLVGASPSDLNGKPTWFPYVSEEVMNHRAEYEIVDPDNGMSGADCDEYSALALAVCLVLGWDPVLDFVPADAPRHVRVKCKGEVIDWTPRYKSTSKGAL